jgi:hypothetical protein
MRSPARYGPEVHDRPHQPEPEPGEWRVVKSSTPGTHEQIASAKIKDLEIRRIVYGLLQAGLVEIIRPEGMVIPMVPKTFTTPNKEEQKSLINKLIGRIRSM